jgi:hypothetical protein
MKQPATSVALCLSGDDDRVYSGNLVADVVRYRVLRARALGGSGLKDDDIGVLSKLDARLRQQPPSDARVRERRYFRRYECSFNGELLYEAGSHEVALDVMVEDLSAGGARVRSDRRFEPGQAVTLVVQIQAATSVCSVRLPARVAWSTGNVAGLMFAGSPVETANNGHHFDCSAARR